MITRASNPAACYCPAASAPTDLPQRRSPLTDLGQVIHERLAAVVNGNAPNWEGLDAEERGLLFAGLDILEEMAPHFVNGMAEVKIPHSEIGNHADWMAGHNSDAPTLAALDWKSGRLEPATHMDQVKTYLFVGLWNRDRLGIPPPDQCFGVVAYLRERDRDPRVFTVPEIMEHGERLLKNARRGQEPDPPFVRGPHCLACPRAGECPAVRRDLAQMDWAGEIAMAGLSGEEIARRRDIVKLAGRAIEAWDEALRAALAAGGPIDLGNGREIALEPQERRNVLASDAMRAAAAAQGVTGEDLDAATTVSLTKLGEAVAKRAARGEKGKAKEALAAALQEAGAIRVTSFFKITEREVQPALIEGGTTHE